MTVSTPNGAIARIVRIFAEKREAEVEFADGRPACFKFGWLTPTRATG